MGEFDFHDFNQLGYKWMSYEGNFLNGKREVVGTLLLTNGEKLIGSFKNGYNHGGGTFIKKDKEQIPAFWMFNKLTKVAGHYGRK